jgi:hypothetical protein
MSEPIWDGNERRMGMSDQGGTLQAKLDALNSNVERLTTVVDENTKALSRLAVLEVNHNNSNAAIERAFKSIEKSQRELEEHIKIDESAHHGYDKWLYTATGFVIAISVFWSAVGYRVNAIIDDQVKAVAEMRMHIHDDKVTSPEQVRAIVK